MSATTDVETDHALAVRLATECGDLLLDLRTGSELSGPPLGAVGDRLAQRHLAAGIRQARPGDRMLSEEAADDLSRLGAHRVWIIDPVDGTREYSQGRHDWAVHVALWQDGDLTAAAVALPVGGRVWATEPPPTVPARRGGALRIAVSRTRPPRQAFRLEEEAGAELVPMGSAGYKTMAILIGEVDAYVHANGQYEWDSAAPVAVARAAGLHTSRIDGSPLTYNQPDPALPDLVVARPEAAETILRVVAPARS